MFCSYNWAPRSSNCKYTSRSRISKFERLSHCEIATKSVERFGLAYAQVDTKFVKKKNYFEVRDLAMKNSISITILYVLLTIWGSKK